MAKLGGPVVIGVDLGTQGLKVLAYSPSERKVLAAAQTPLDLDARADGSREQDAACWVAALQTCMQQLDPAVRARVVALGVSGQQHGFVPVGGSGEVLAPVKLWNDTSTQDECAAIEAALGGAEQAVAMAGNRILPGYTASKVLWLQRHKPQAYASLRHILLPHDYLNFYLTGAYGAECGDASGTGFFDIRKRRWSEAVLRAIDPERDLRSLLPPLLAPTQVVGTLLPRVAAVLGLPGSVQVAVGGGDNMMGAIGTGAVVPGVLTLSLGTSGTLYGYSTAPVISQQQEFAAFCDSTGGYLPLVCTMNCTASTEIMRSMLQLQLSDFEHLLTSAAPGAGGVVAVPFFNGERTPDCPSGKGCFFGLTASNSGAGNLLRAVVESTIFGLRTGLAAMQDAGLTSTAVRLIGGGSHSQEWRQIVADVLKVDVAVPEQSESAAFGAALQALWCHQHSQGEAVAISRLVMDHVACAATKGASPRPSVAAAYDLFFADYLQHARIVQALYK